MDKSIAILVIVFFASCASFITWAVLSTPKVSKTARILSYVYAALVWLCVISITVLTIIYHL